MLKLIQTEFWKLRRKSLFWLMLLTALLMPFFAVIYFRSFGKTDLDPLLFYKWSAFGYTVFMILPFILGIVCTILMHEENQAHVLKQLWIIPVPKTACFFHKSTRYFPTCSHNFPKAGEARFQGRSRLFRLLGKFPYLGESRRILMAVSSKTSSKTRFYYAATRRISSAAVQPSIWA